MGKEFKVGLFNDSFLPFMDGVTNTVYNYAFWLNRMNFLPLVVTPYVPGYKDNEEFDVTRYFSIPIPKRSTYRLGISSVDFPFLKKIREYHLDLIHAHSPFSAGHLALKIAKERNIPIISTFHSKFYDDFYNEIHSKLLTNIILKYIINFFNRCDFIWTVNKGTVETLRSYGYKKDVEIFPNGCDFISPDKSEKKELERMIREKHNIKVDVPILLFVGQHIWQKNVKTIIDALGIVKNNRGMFKMIFIGKGEAEDEMKKMVKDLNLLSDVIFCGFISNRDELKAYYSSADLFVFPSEYDNSPIVLQEAASCACPAILLEGSNAAEGIIDGYNGFLISNTKESLAKKLIDLLKNREYIKKIGENARRTIYKSWEDIVKQVKERYIQIIKEWKNKI